MRHRAARTSPRQNATQTPIDNTLKKSSIEFDRHAGVGPHEERRSIKPPVPELPTLPRRDAHAINFSVDYDQPDYVPTTMAAHVSGLTGVNPENVHARDIAENSLPTRVRSGYTTEMCRVPPCSELANHGDQGGSISKTNCFAYISSF
jgi:hypothetical protein